jgi:hypothetical protein
MKKGLLMKAMTHPGEYVAKKRRWFGMTLLQALLIGLLTRIVLYQNPGIGEGMFIAVCIALLYGLHRSSYGKSYGYTLHLDQEGLLLTDRDGKTIEQIAARDMKELRTEFIEENPMEGSLRGIILALVNKPILDKFIVHAINKEKTFYLLPESDHARDQVRQYAEVLVSNHTKTQSLV